MAALEAALRRLEGVEQVVVSLEKQMFAVTFVPGSGFQPKALRAAAVEAHIDVIRFHLAAAGRVHRDGPTWVFVSGKDSFLVVNPPKDLPVDRTIGVMAVVDDSTTPWRLTLNDFKPLDE